MRMVDLGKYEPIATAPRDGTLVWVYSELVGEVLARHIEDSAWRGSDQFILPTHWRHATAEEVTSFQWESAARILSTCSNRGNQSADNSRSAPGDVDQLSLFGPAIRHCLS